MCQRSGLASQAPGTWSKLRGSDLITGGKKREVRRKPVLRWLTAPKRLMRQQSRFEEQSRLPSMKVACAPVTAEH